MSNSLFSATGHSLTLLFYDTYVFLLNFAIDEFEELCSRGPGFGPGPTGPDGQTDFITGSFNLTYGPLDF